MAKVYLSPPYHWFNTCSIEGCDETTHNNEYMDYVEEYLKSCGIEYRRGPRRVPKSNEDGNALMKQAVAESNAWGADIHYVSHTNGSVSNAADIGKGKAKGCRPIIYKGSTRGEKLAECMLKYRKEVYTGPITLNRRTDLYELSAPTAVSFYEEHIFHDNMEDALWFHSNMKAVARSAVQGMCEYLGVPFVETANNINAEYEALKEKYNTLQASADAFRTRVMNALEIFDNGKGG